MLHMCSPHSYRYLKTFVPKLRNINQCFSLSRSLGLLIRQEKCNLTNLAMLENTSF